MSRQRSMETILVSEYVSIGELVRITGVRYSTLKYYTEEGIRPFEQAEETPPRRFPRENAVRQIERIRSLRLQGLSIPEIKERLG